MDSGPAPPPSYQPSPEIPQDIFQPLLKIAQQGYDANDIRHYYMTMLNHLRRMGTENAEAAYTLVTPNSDRKVSFAMDDDSSSDRQTVESYEDHISPRTVPTGWSWSRSASYEPSIQEQSDLVASVAPQDLYSLSPEELHQPQHMDLSIPQMSDGSQITPTQQSFNQQVGNNRSQDALAMSANFTPSPNLDVNDISPSSHENLSFGSDLRPQQAQWIETDDFGNQTDIRPLHTQPQPQTNYSQLWPSMHSYHPGMSHTRMPLMMSYPHSQTHRSFTDSFSFSHNLRSGGGLSQLATELYHSPFFPTIDVIPSRKRRRVLKTGVKKIAQSLGNARQASDG